MRGQILDKAKIIINGERQDTNGNPEDSFFTIAELWNTFLNSKFPEGPIDLQRKDVALLMTLLKIARETHQNKEDNLIDAAGYLGIAGDFKEDVQLIECCLKTQVKPDPKGYGQYMCEPNEYHG